MTTRLALVALLLFASGCAPMVWVRPGTPPAEFRQDLAQCREQAWQEAAWRSRGWGAPPYGPGFVRHGFGWHPIYGWAHAPFADPFADRFFDESRLADFCMRAKGYELAPADEVPAA